MSVTVTVTRVSVTVTRVSVTVTRVSVTVTPLSLTVTRVSVTGAGQQSAAVALPSLCQPRLKRRDPPGEYPGQLKLGLHALRHRKPGLASLFYSFLSFSELYGL